MITGLICVKLPGFTTFKQEAKTLCLENRISAPRLSHYLVCLVREYR